MNERIKELRTYFGLSKNKFAGKIGKTGVFIADVEAGRTGLSEKTFQAICTIFGVSNTWLRDGLGPMFMPGKEKAAADLGGIPERLKEIRKNAGLTQLQFGDKVGCHKNQVYRVETGQIHPSEEFLLKVAKKFNVSYDWLMTGTGDMDAQPLVVDDKLIAWLNENPDIIMELKQRAGLD